MRERPLVYLVPRWLPRCTRQSAWSCRCSLALPPIALLLVLAAVFLRRHKCLLTVFAVLAAAALR